MLRLAAMAIAVLVAWSAPACADGTSVRIGVLAYRGKEEALRQWVPHAAYLSEKLAPVRFEIVPMGYGELTDAVHARKLDFVITNTGHYTEMELVGDASRIATRILSGPDGPLDRFGGVVIARAGRDDIDGYRDIPGRRLMVPDQSSLGGWQVHLREAHDQGVDLSRAASIVETHNHEAVVRGVRDGLADIGFIRSDLLEQMAAAGEISLADFKVVSPRSEKGYPYRLSTRLYPEWPLAVVQGASEELARDVLITLLRMQPTNRAATAAGIQGWVVPLSYKPVDELFRAMRLGPYSSLDFALRDVVRSYWPLMGAGGLAVILALSLSMVRMVLSRRQLVTEMGRRTEAEQRLVTLNMAVAQSPASVVIADGDRRIVYVNDTFCRLTGFARDEVEGRNVGVLASPQTPDSLHREIWDRLAGGEAWSGDLCSQRKDGGVLWEHAVISPVADAEGRVVSYIAIKQDLTLLRTYEDALDRAASYDDLTGLPNRILARDRLDRLCAEGEGVAVLHVAVDKLSRVNDSLGRNGGDTVIALLAQRFGALIAASDTLARLGGDEFLVLRPAPRDRGEVDALANALLAAAARPLSVDGVDLRISVRIGVAVGPTDGAGARELKKAASNAATRARQAGGNCIRHFLPSMDADARWRMDAEAGLRQALADGALDIHLQPYVDAQSGIFAGAEVLARWRRPGDGFVPPSRFIPLAESSGVIGDLDRLVIERAVAAGAQLRDRLGRTFPVAVNVSPVTLHEPGIVEFTAAVLRRHGLPPAGLEIEITEGVFMSAEETAGETLRAFDALGVPIAIDDFGTGFSSLAYLRRYPVSKVKLDRSFVTGMDGDPRLRGLASAVAAMAGHLGLTVTAEGVERAEEWEVLRASGYDFIQGYLFARPMTLAELERLVSAPALSGGEHRV